MLLVGTTFAIMCLAPVSLSASSPSASPSPSSDKCLTANDCLPDMPFSGATISMRCDIACRKCFSKRAGLCLRMNPNDECSHTCVCSGLPVWPSRLRGLDEEYCQFAKTNVQHVTKATPK